jgi:predicted 3-demethylubiquinone-9 3-methyltransferase (glyoxalase superfamily)
MVALVRPVNGRRVAGSQDGSGREELMESVHTHLMFQNGRAREALHRYEELFGGAFTIDELHTYDEAAAGPTGQVQMAICTLLGRRLSCIDSPVQHDFDMTPAISLFVECNDHDELERLFAALSDDGVVFMPLDDYGFSRRYGWVQDQFGVPWQLNLR